jgi:DNA-binding MarR family transcriptional regulator
MKSASSTPADDAFAFLLVTAARLLRFRLEAALSAAQLEITTSEARTLAMADRLGPVRQAELAANLGIEPMSLVHHLDRLEKAGLIQREPDPNDRRSKLTYLTPTAQPQLKRIRQVLNQARVGAMRQFSSAELTAFQSYLQRLCRDLMDDA